MRSATRAREDVRGKAMTGRGVGRGLDWWQEALTPIVSIALPKERVSAGLRTPSPSFCMSEPQLRGRGCIRARLGGWSPHKRLGREGYA